MKQQEAFFLHGVAHLRPMTLRQVADAIEMHELTVSRVTSNKYLSCARGLFELKYFFTRAIQSSDGGDAVSAEAVKSGDPRADRGRGPQGDPVATTRWSTCSTPRASTSRGARSRNIARRSASAARSSARRQKALEGRGLRPQLYGNNP